jgi:hypothetical protein
MAGGTNGSWIIRLIAMVGQLQLSAATTKATAITIEAFMVNQADTLLALHRHDYQPGHKHAAPSTRNDGRPLILGGAVLEELPPFGMQWLLGQARPRVACSVGTERAMCIWRLWGEMLTEAASGLLSCRTVSAHTASVGVAGLRAATCGGRPRPPTPGSLGPGSGPRSVVALGGAPSSIGRRPWSSASS